MPQSSALRREEAAPAPTPITINAQDVPKQGQIVQRTGTTVPSTSLTRFPHHLSLH